MFSWLKKEGEKTESIENVVEGLKRIYKTKLLPLELHHQFHDFHSPQLEDPDFDAKPMILLVGQYSTGKTTFIKYLLERDFPGIRIGPEPTTDRFIAVMHDEKEGMIPGNALVVDPKKQFRPLSKFGNAFLNRFQCSTVNSPVLRGISIVDTPGILSGEKQRVDRGYDFTGVLEWFAERVDRIILLFDAHKLDISDEFRRSIEALRGHDDKIRIVLNKADMIDHQQLMRVYGALMWSLGKVLQTPEVARVYIGSFWDQPLRYDVNRRLFEDEEQDLFKDMQSLPRNAALRKLNDLIKRARLAKVHAYIVSELRKEMPSMFGKEGKKKELIKNLGQVYDRLQRELNISPGDFPDIKKMQENLANHDFTKFNPLKPKLLEVVDQMLSTDIARLMDMIPQEDINIVTEPLIKGRADVTSGEQVRVSPHVVKGASALVNLGPEGLATSLKENFVITCAYWVLNITDSLIVNYINGAAPSGYEATPAGQQGVGYVGLAYLLGLVRDPTPANAPACKKRWAAGLAGVSMVNVLGETFTDGVWRYIVEKRHTLYGHLEIRRELLGRYLSMEYRDGEPAVVRAVLSQLDLVYKDAYLKSVNLMHLFSKSDSRVLEIPSVLDEVMKLDAALTYVKSVEGVNYSTCRLIDYQKHPSLNHTNYPNLYAATFEWVRRSKKVNQDIVRRVLQMPPVNLALTAEQIEWLRAKRGYIVPTTPLSEILTSGSHKRPSTPVESGTSESESEDEVTHGRRRKQKSRRHH